MTRILVVDDEVKICEFIKACLENEGYEVIIAHNGYEAIRKFKNRKINLIILDRMMPNFSGEEVCEYIRNTSECPIIMLTAKIEEDDRIDGFKLGCDDYICKPFNITELIYRVKSILKRSGVESNDGMISYGDKLQISTLSHEVRINGKVVQLTNTEYKILLLLSENPKKVFTREEILEKTIEEYFDKADRAIDTHIKNLRQKLEDNITNEKIIQTIYGVGYRFGFEK